MIHGWRITAARHVDTAFTGRGAYETPGRWHSPGQYVVYLGSGPCIASVETMVHRPSPTLLQDDFVIIPVQIPEELVLELDRSALPDGWSAPDDYSRTAPIGDRWLADQPSVALIVPSAAIPLERNLLLNPAHPDMAQVTVGAATPFLFDPRLAPPAGP